MAFIPAMGMFRNREKLALKPLGGKPLLAYTVEEALKSDLVERVIVSTEDHDIAENAVKYGAEVPFLRPMELARTGVSVEDVLRHMIGALRAKGEEIPGLIVVLNYFVPFKEERHITEGIDTILLYDTDSVISVVTDISFHWKIGKLGLAPVGYQKRLLREDKETIYKESGAFYVVRTAIVEAGGYLGEKIGHVEMSLQSSWRVEDDFTFWVAEKMAEDKRMPAGLSGAERRCQRA
jgi:CMP-N-acetylneuraminic acid synthetase